MLTVDQIKAIIKQRTGEDSVCYGGGVIDYGDGEPFHSPILLEVCVGAEKFPSLLGLDAIEEMQKRLAGLGSFLGILHKEMELSLEMGSVTKGSFAAGLVERWMTLIDAIPGGEGGKPDGE